MIKISLYLLLSVANAFSFRDEVKVDRKCFMSYPDLKCSSYKYMVINKEMLKDSNRYSLAPGKGETVPSLCIVKRVNESCLALVKKK